MKKKHWLLAAALVAAPVVAVPGAGALPVKASASVVGPVRIDAGNPSIGYVTARYVCQAGDPEAEWLWVSAKQAADGRPDPALRQAESSGVAAAWVQSHPLGEFTCDGGWHTDTFQINTEVDGFTGAQGFGELVPGQVWVQFCLFDGQGNFVSFDRWAEVG